VHGDCEEFQIIAKGNSAIALVVRAVDGRDGRTMTFDEGIGNGMQRELVQDRSIEKRLNRVAIGFENSRYVNIEVHLDVFPKE
jgi:hypothetical protein